MTLIAPEEPINRNFPVIRGSQVTFRGIDASSAITEISASRACLPAPFSMWCTWSESAALPGSGGASGRRPFYIQDYDEAMSAAIPTLTRRLYYGLVEMLTRQRAHAVVVASRALERFFIKCRPDLGSRLLDLPIGYDPSFENQGQHLHVQTRYSRANARCWFGWAACSPDMG